MRNKNYKMMWDFVREWLERSVRHDVKECIEHDEAKESLEYIKGFTDCDIFTLHLMQTMERCTFSDGVDLGLFALVVKDNYEDYQKLKEHFFAEYQEGKNADNQ